MSQQTIYAVECPTCNGSGGEIYNPCGQCDGTGSVIIQEQADIPIKAVVIGVLGGAMFIGSVLFVWYMLSGRMR